MLACTEKRWISFTVRSGSGQSFGIVKETGFTILCQEDQTALWREYYLDAIWNDSFCCEDHKLLQKEYKGRKIGYIMIVGRKE